MSAHDVMTGATGLRAVLSTFYGTYLPPLIEVRREQAGYDDWQLPEPMRYDSYDPLTVSEYPTVGSIIPRTTDWERVDLDEYGQEVYEANYNVRVWVWVRTPDNSGTWETPEYDTCLRVRDDLLALMRSVTLAVPSLGSAATKMKEDSLAEDYLDAIKSGKDSPRWMAGGTLSFNVAYREANYLPEIGTADDIAVETLKLVP